jgi:hypothetical protein
MLEEDGASSGSSAQPLQVPRFNALHFSGTDWNQGKPARIPSMKWAVLISTVESAMQILHSAHTQQPPLPKLLELVSSDSRHLSTGDAVTPSGGPLTAEGFERLLQSVKEDVAVRPDKVAQAQAKLEQGLLSTRFAAEAAASAMLREFS